MKRIRQLEASRAVALAAALASLSPSRAHAQQADAAAAAAAQRLFEEGRELMAEGRYEEACPRLAESQRLDPGTGTLLNLADCYERTGRDASAWATYKLAETSAKRQGHRPRVELAVEGAERTLARAALLTISVARRPPGLVVTRNDEPVGPGSFGVAVPVDPGAYVLEATADGRAPWRKEITIGRSERLVVEVPELAPAPLPATKPPSAPPPSGAPGETDDTGSDQRTLGWIVAGAGAVGVGVGLAFGLSAKAKNDEARQDECTAVSCTSRGGQLIDDAERAATLSTIFVVGGAVAAAGGIVLVLTAPRAPTTLRASVRGPVLEIGGTF